MNSTRDQILNVIKAQGQATIAELSAALGISPVSVRHHLAALQARGLIQATEARQGVGRPHHVYTLTATAMERFPTKYMHLSERLLDELKAALPPETIEAMFARMAQDAVSEYAARLEGKPLEQKMDLLVEILGTEGFMAQWNKTGESLLVTEYNCPYLRLGQRHPEVCVMDEAVMRQVLQANVEKTTCVLNGAERCVFVINLDKPVTAA